MSERGLLCPACWQFESIEKIANESRTGRTNWRELWDLQAEIDIFGNDILRVRNSEFKEVVHRCSPDGEFVSYKYKGEDFLVEKLDDNTYRLIGKFWRGDREKPVVVRLEREGDRVILRDVETGEIYMQETGEVEVGD